MKKLSINEIKQVGLEILICFHKFCEDNNLTYYLAYGTLLGAVRHKGFIPWDDDIDVYMPRNDYEKILKDFDIKNTNKIFKTLSIYNDENYYREFARIVNIKTTLINKTIPHLWIDIFPLDNMSDNYKKAICLQKKIRFFKYLRTHKVEKFNVYSNIIQYFKNIIHKIIKFSIFFIRLKYLIRKIDNLSKKYMQNRMTQYIGRVDSNFRLEIYDSSLFRERILLDFEGYKFWAPKEYDTILTQYFGNYMELPPENKRKNHSIEVYLKEE